MNVCCVCEILRGFLGCRNFYLEQVIRSCFRLFHIGECIDSCRLGYYWFSCLFFENGGMHYEFKTEIKVFL